jgi:hypothetical protein
MIKAKVLTPNQIVRYYVRGKDIGYYLRNMVMTYNTETNACERWGTGFTEEYKLKLIKICEQIVECSVKGRKFVDFPPDMLILKSRQTMLSWTLSAVLSHQMIYQRDFYGIITSINQEALDNAIYTDYNTAMGKVHYILNHMPEYLRPAEEDISRSFKTITYLPTGGTVKADSSRDPGRGKGVNIAFQDEIAKQEFSFSKQAALVEAVKGCNVMNSTPSGKANVFYQMYQYATKNPEKSSFQTTTIHWKEKVPKEQWDEWYADALERNNGDTAKMAQELEHSWDGLDMASKVWPMFSPAVSCVKLDPLTYIPGHCFLVFDYGYGDPAVETLFTIDTNLKKLILLDCTYASGEFPKQRAISTNSMLAKWHLNITQVKCIGDPSGSQVRGDNFGNSFVNQWRELGYFIDPADNSIAEGISTIAGYLSDSTFQINDSVEAVKDAPSMAVWPIDKDNNVTKTDYKIGAPYTDILDTVRYGVLFARTVLIQYGIISTTRGIGMGIASVGIPLDPNRY